ncbi:hypothetical protein SynPROS91_01130 [Synechococcus sp. PROS-9-1]|nr:hypothetical protein [Synechococcus sp. PROS-9-1]QNJ31508.1 hypothetical protein SynPROS91_01130 [Synechococcus sp. PROS-9-1]
MIRDLAATFLERLQQRIDLGRVFGGSETPPPDPEPEEETP